MLESGHGHGNGETLLRKLRGIGELRDAFIVAIFVVHFVGLLTWSMNSFVNRIGFVGLLDVRYWIAGFAPEATIFCCVFGFYSLTMPRRIEPAMRVFFDILIIISLVFVCMQGYVRWKTLVASNLPNRPWRNELFASAFMAFVFTFTLIVGCLGKTYDDRVWKTRLVGSNALKVAFVTMAATSISLYIAFIFPNIPQELGGGAPRCADIDLQTGTLSPKAIAEMGGVNWTAVQHGATFDKASGTIDNKKDSGTMRIENFQVLHSSSDTILGKFEKPPERVEGFRVVHLEVARSSVNAIAWKRELCEKKSILKFYYR